VFERVGDLLTEALLDREAVGEQAHQAGELGQAQDALVRDVAEVRGAVERQGVVLAQRVERDRPFDDLADKAVLGDATLGGEGGEELGIPVPAVES
jgi:hypothetical protein